MADWDAKYAAAPEGLFGTAPNEYLRGVVARSDFGPRSALCLADGDGRNSRFLASRGLAVTAVDISRVGTENAQRLDHGAGVVVERIVADLEHWEPQSASSWDAVFLFYLQAPWPTRRAALDTGWRVLGAGGWLVFEGFGVGDAGEEGVLGPQPEDLRYRLAECLDRLSGAVIVEALEGQIGLAEGSRHKGLAKVMRLAVRKP
ncbi:MAG: class I SAM-dependent methyltransferase [Hyphomicrobiaceae bacterium]|nr:class I SAM-dependent methyltransferase [Hyphomicrobiaceae bacterium]